MNDRTGMNEYDREYAEKQYYVPAEFEKMGGIWPLHAGRNIAKQNYCSVPRHMGYYSLHIVLEGGVLLSHADEAVALRQGDAFCLFPGAVMSGVYRIDPAMGELRMFWLAFDGGQAAELLKQAGLLSERPYRRQAFAVQGESMPVEPMLTDMLRHFRLSRDATVYLSLISLMYKLFGCMLPFEREDTAVQPQDAGGWLQRSVGFMNAHYMEGITVADAADAAGVNRSYFSTRFAERLGVSPVRYLQRLKMDKAASLLAHTSYTVTEVGLSLGYPDVYAFTRAFTRYYGKAPSLFRGQ